MEMLLVVGRLEVYRDEEIDSINIKEGEMIGRNGPGKLDRIVTVEVF